MKLPDAARRAMRTFAQAFFGVLAAQAAALAVQIPQGTWVPDVDWAKRLAISAGTAGVIACVTYLHNYFEDTGAIPAVGKAMASSGADPVTIDPVK